MLVERMSGVEIVGEANNGREVMEHLRTLRPDIILKESLFQRLSHLRIFRKSPRRLLRIDFLAINNHLKSAIVEWDEGERLHSLFVFTEQLFRQTDGFRFVTSRSAVFDTDIHGGLL